jgi:hypothetical protein
LQCDGDRTLAGLLISTETSIGVWYAGLIGMFVVEHALAALALHFYHPGGVKFARATSARKGKENGMTDALDIPRQQIDVEVRSEPAFCTADHRLTLAISSHRHRARSTTSRSSGPSAGSGPSRRGRRTRRSCAT